LGYNLISSVDLTSPVLITYQKMYGTTPSVSETNMLTQFANSQLVYGQQVGVLDPMVYVYQALAAVLTESSDTGSTDFKNKWGPLAIATDTTFVSQAYTDVFGFAPAMEAAQVFLNQVAYFKSIYTSSGAFGADANRIDL